MPETWQHAYECPQCGQGEKDLVDTARPEVVRSMGKSALVSCQICRKQFLVKAPA